MNLRQAIFELVKAASWEAARDGRTLRGDIELRLPDDPDAPALRFGAGPHDYRMCVVTPPGGEPAEADAAAAVKAFADAALGAPAENPLAEKIRAARTAARDRFVADQLEIQKQLKARRATALPPAHQPPG